jgi:NAD(P)-dependent dehydrogenase (short-subunit alcohol dehydrogenase family)
MWSVSSLPSLEGKTFIVTGGNTGIGYATCLNLIAKGARVYMGARSSTKATAAISKINESHPGADLHVLLMDHTSLSTIVLAAKSFCSQESKLHGLILNAGIMAVPYQITADGFEVQMQVNYIAHWLLAYHLLPILLSTSLKDGEGSVRVISVTSEGHRRPWNVPGILYDEAEIKAFGRWGLYGVSKLADILLAKSLHASYGPGSTKSKEGKGKIWAAAAHPGFIDTQINEKNRDSVGWNLKWVHGILRTFKVVRPWDEGCVSSLFVAASPQFKREMSGLYFDNKASIMEPSPAAMSEEERLKLETWTQEVMKKGGWISGTEIV